MAPAPTQEGLLAKRYYCDVTGCYDDYSTWDNWGRWVALALIIIFFLALAVTFSSRRRRRRGLAPMYGTGWMGGNKPPVGNQQYGQTHNGGWGGGGQQHYAAPPPPYMGNQATGTTFNPNDGYYGNQNGQQGGIELQAPGASYQPQRGGEPVYTAPAGPPPGKGDGIIR